MVTVQQPALIFVSHSHAENEFSAKLVNDLRNQLGAGTEIWHDISGGLNGGDEWWKVIVEKINACDIFLLIISSSALQSNAVEAELNMAWSRKFAGKTRIIPILYAESQTRLDLTTLQYVSFLPPKSYEHGLTELVATLLLPTSNNRWRFLAVEPEPVAASAGQLSPPRRALPLVVPTLLILSIAAATDPRQIAITGDALTVGRDPDNDLLIADDTVSRHHLVIERRQSSWWVQRLPGSGVVLINGQARDTLGLHSGDQIVIGGTVLRFELPTAQSNGTTSDAASAQTVSTSATTPQLTVDCTECHFVAPLRDATITLGRGPENGIVIPAPVIHTRQAMLSRLPDGGYIIRDEGTTNFITLRGQRLHNYRLRSGDTLTIGANIPGHSVTLTYAAVK